MVGTITVDVSRGGDYALADYARQSCTHTAIRRLSESMKMVGACMCGFGVTMVEAIEGFREFGRAFRAMESPELRALFDEEE